MWWSIEVLDAAFPASLWQDAHGSFLIEAALTRRGRNWRWHRHAWGVVFEVEFDDEDTWETFRRLPAVQAALDAVPDPIEGLLIYPGRGGSSGRVAPRRTSPTSGAGAAALPIPPEEILPEPAPDPRSTTADLAPFLLGEGGRLFEDLPPDHVELELVRVLERRDDCTSCRCCWAAAGGCLTISRPSTSNSTSYGRCRPPTSRTQAGRSCTCATASTRAGVAE